MILAGDIGGTKTVLALYEPAGDELTQVREEIFHSHDYATFDEIVTKFLKGGPALRAACFGVAGPVVHGRVHTTNLPWNLDEQELTGTTHSKSVKLLNDLEAAAYGMLFLKPDEFCVLNAAPTPPEHGNIAVIAAGTGLGEAMLYWDGDEYQPAASEGGHVGFAPQTDQEIELLIYLRAKFHGHVSYERILSGPGIYNVFAFLRDKGYGTASPELAAQLKMGDPNAVISQHALSGSDPLCVQTLDLFAAIYGAEAGNLALKCASSGGVYIAGGIAPKILPVLQNGRFMEGFLDKGRLKDFVKPMEVRVALNPRAPLLGAAHFALRPK